MVWSMKPILDGSIESLLSETDIELARTGLEAELKLLEGVIRTSPKDEQLLVLAAQGFTGYAMMFLEGEDKERALLMYDRGRMYGMRALGLSIPELLIDDLTFNEFKSLLTKLKRKDLPAAYWTATAWASRINLDLTSPKALRESPRATSLMQWVMDSEPHYYFSGPLWFFGTYYSSLPPIMGGNIERAKGFFEQAMYADGNRFLWGKLLYAKKYSVQALDRELFEKLLNEIIAGANDEPEELRLLNRIASIKAEELLKNIDEIF